MTTPISAATVGAFSHADCETMSLMALVMKFLSIPPATTPEQVSASHHIADVLSHRLSKERIALADPLKFKVVDKLMSVAPHLCLRPVKEVCEAVVVPRVQLIVVVDTSGSMSSCITPTQQALKAWIQPQLKMYKGVSIVFFDTFVHGPFSDLACLDSIHGKGKTAATPALKVLRNLLTSHGPSHVVVLTDGEFDEKKDAYNIPVLPNVERFVLMFPWHTPVTAEADHFAYLPRVCPAGIPIYAKRVADVTEIPVVLASSLTGPSWSLLQPTLYSVVAGEYAMLNNMTIFQMNKLVTDLLQYQAVDLVHNFFSHVLGMYNAMMTKSGDLLNTLRSPEMRLMWGMLQPLKKQFALVPETHLHYPTTTMVLEFLEAFENSVVEMRDKRLKELSKLAKSAEVTAEVNEIKKAFSDMKKVDDYDRIVSEIKRLKDTYPGSSVLTVKYYHTSATTLEAFRIYPSTSRAQTLEMYTMIASLGLCDATDPDAIQLVQDPGVLGMLLVLRLLSYRPTDEIRMTLTATQATRLLYGFVTSQCVRVDGGMYKSTPCHAPIREMLFSLATKRYSYNIMSNLTNTAEPINVNPEWTRVLATLAPFVSVPTTHPLTDKTLWVENTDGSRRLLNKSYLDSLVARDTALFYVRSIHQSDERDVRVVTTYTVDLPQGTLEKFVVVRDRRCQTADEWASEVNHIQSFASGDMPITNLMILQQSLTQNAATFLQKYWSVGHRKIPKTGMLHPVSTYGENFYIRDAVDTWMRTAWIEYLASIGKGGAVAESAYPVVGNAEARAAVVKFLEARVLATPITYQRDPMSSIPVEVVVLHTAPCGHITPRVRIGALNMCEIPTFFQMSSDEQHAKATEIMTTKCLPEDVMGPAVPSIPTYPSDFVYHSGDKAMPPEFATRLKNMIPKLVARMSPLELVEGVGEGPTPKKSSRSRRTVADWVALEVSVGGFMEHTAVIMCEEDFTCPLSGEVFVDPVCFGGHVYEKAWLAKWLEKDERRSSPLTRESVDATGCPLQMESPPRRFIVEWTHYREQCKKP